MVAACILQAHIVIVDECLSNDLIPRRSFLRQQNLLLVWNSRNMVICDRYQDILAAAFHEVRSRLPNFNIKILEKN